MKETFFKVILILIAAGIGVPLLINMWPSDTVVVKKDQALTETVVVPNDWVEYKGDSIAFWHPSRLTVSETAGVSGFTSIDDEVALITFADATTIRQNTDSPFDGFTLYSYNLSNLKTEVTYDEFIGAEKVRMEANFKAMNGENAEVPEIISTTVTLGEHEVTKIDTPFGTITMYYVRVPTSNTIYLFSGVEKDTDSFLSELEDIIKTATFIE